jgi:hypothetical protein
LMGKWVTPAPFFLPETKQWCTIPTYILGSYHEHIRSGVQ